MCIYIINAPQVDEKITYSQGKSPQITPIPNPIITVTTDNIDPKETIYIEDIAKNLSIGYERGCTTVWLINDVHFGKIDSNKDYISHKIENLSLFLKEIRLLKSQ